MYRHLNPLVPADLIQGPYLGEDGTQDAFQTIMEILASRIPHGYKPSPEIMERLTHKGFPCREDQAPKEAGEWGPRRKVTRR